MKRTTHRLAALAAVATIGLAGCASGDSSSEDVRSPEQSSSAEGEGGDSTASATTGQQEEHSQPRSDSDAEAGGDSDSQSDSDASSDPAGTHIARTAGLTVTVEDIEQASAKVRSAASSVGGYVSSEQTRLEDEGSSGAAGSRAELVVTVPVDDLDSTMASLAKVGTVTERTSDATDLSKQYTDTEARVRSMKKSITRLRTLIDETEDLEQIVDLESELAKREADLESKVSQQKSLEKRTTTAPITVTLTTPGTAAEEPEEETGFVAGLGQGWDGFTSATTVALTVLGAVTPFALTALVVLAPIGWWLRRRVRRGSTSTEVSAS